MQIQLWLELQHSGSEIDARNAYRQHKQEDDPKGVVTRKLAKWIFMVVAVIFASQSSAQAVPKAKLCKDGRVDRQMLAEYLLDKYNFSWRAEAYQRNHAAPSVSGLPIEQQIIAQPMVCPAYGDEASSSCNSNDNDAIVRSTLVIMSLLTSDGPDFRANGRAQSPADFFLNQEAAIECLGSTQSPQPTSEVAKHPPADQSANDTCDGKSPTGAWRVRGGADQMYVRQTSALFAGVDKLQVGLSEDKVQDKSAKKVIGDVGYAFTPQDCNGNVFQLTPYAGINDNTTNVDGKGRTYTADTRNAGVAFSYQWVPSYDPRREQPSTAYVVTLRPDYLWNRRNHSRLATLNGSFIPYRMNALNAPITSTEGRIVLGTVFDIRSDYGHYTSKGNAETSTTDDYFRLGTRVGLTLSSMAGTQHPLDWLITSTILHGFRGSPRDIHYFKSTFSFGFDSKKNIGLDLSYSTGRREDTGESERGWSLTFGAKY